MQHLFTGQVPVTLDAHDGSVDSHVTLGTAWYSDYDGIVHGARFYLGNRNFDTSTIVGGVFDYHTGELLAQGSLPITAALPTGYTSIPFSEPIVVKRNTWYVVGICYPCNSSPDGESHYVVTSGFFATDQFDNPPLHAFKSDSIMDRRNGLFKYGSSLVFPNEFFGSPNYFSDIDFEFAAFMPVYNSGTDSYTSHPVKHRVGGEWVL